MRKKELREVVVTYCDRCKKELKGNYKSLEYKDGRRMDFCSNYVEGVEKNCYDAHYEDELKSLTPPLKTVRNGRKGERDL